MITKKGVSAAANSAYTLAGITLRLHSIICVLLKSSWNELALPGQLAVQPVPLPVTIDYPAALALRQMTLTHDEAAEIPVCRGGENSPQLCAWSALQNAAGHPLEYWSVH